MESCDHSNIMRLLGEIELQCNAISSRFADQIMGRREVLGARTPKGQFSMAELSVEPPSSSYHEGLRVADLPGAAGLEDDSDAVMPIAQSMLREEALRELHATKAKKEKAVVLVEEPTEELKLPPARRGYQSR